MTNKYSNIIKIKANDEGSSYLAGSDELCIKNGIVYGAGLNYTESNSPIVIMDVEDFFNIDRNINSFPKGTLGTGVNGISSNPRYVRYIINFKGVDGNYVEEYKRARNAIYNFFNSSRSFTYSSTISQVDSDLFMEMKATVYIDDFYYDFNDFTIEVALMFENQYLERDLEGLVFTKSDIYPFGVNNGIYPTGSIYPEITVDVEQVRSVTTNCKVLIEGNEVVDNIISFSGYPVAVDGIMVKYLKISTENRTAFMLDVDGNVLGSAIRYINKENWYKLDINFTNLSSITFTHNAVMRLKYHSIEVY